MGKKDEFELPEVLGRDWGYYRPRHNLVRAKRLEDGRWAIVGANGLALLKDDSAFGSAYVEVPPAKVDNEGHLSHLA